MVFYNREDDIRRMKAVLSGEPNLLYFVYGPINSGKTALLMKVLEELPEEYRVFYINFRRLETRRYEDFIRALFTVKYQGIWEKVKEKSDLMLGGIEFLEKVAKKINYTIPIPKEVFKVFIRGEEGETDCFKYLEEVMRRLNGVGKRPILVLDELQMLKEIKKNGPILHDLFNFLVGMTKETHLCHSLCSTSDCLFIEDIYSNARLEGRAKYILVDDLPKDDAFKLYDGFGFNDKELVWGWIGGKVGDMMRLYEEKKQGYSEEEGLRNMLKDEVGRLGMYLRLLRYTGAKVAIKGKEVEVKEEDIRSGLGIFKSGYKIKADEMEEPVLFELVQENILFYNPVEGTVCPQGRLIHRAIEEVIT